MIETPSVIPCPTCGKLTMPAIGHSCDGPQAGDLTSTRRRPEDDVAELQSKLVRREKAMAAAILLARRSSGQVTTLMASELRRGLDDTPDWPGS